MTNELLSLSTIFDGWDGYQTSIVHAVEPLTPEQLNWRPGPNLRSVGELAGHIASGRLSWFKCMPAPGSVDLALKAQSVNAGGDITGDRDVLIYWLDATWKMIADTLKQWTVADLRRSYRHAYAGQVYAVSFQWTIWRILTHDIHHGGELALMLSMQGLETPELGDLFGHITDPPLAE